MDNNNNNNNNNHTDNFGSRVDRRKRKGHNQSHPYRKPDSIKQSRNRPKNEREENEAPPPSSSWLKKLGSFVWSFVPFAKSEEKEDGVHDESEAEERDNREPTQKPNVVTTPSEEGLDNIMEALKRKAENDGLTLNEVEKFRSLLDKLAIKEDSTALLQNGNSISSESSVLRGSINNNNINNKNNLTTPNFQSPTQLAGPSSSSSSSLPFTIVQTPQPTTYSSSSSMHKTPTQLDLVNQFLKKTTPHNAQTTPSLYPPTPFPKDASFDHSYNTQSSSSQSQQRYPVYSSPAQNDYYSNGPYPYHQAPRELQQPTQPIFSKRHRSPPKIQPSTPSFIEGNTDWQPPSKRRIPNLNVPPTDRSSSSSSSSAGLDLAGVSTLPTSETAKKIFNTLDQISSPLSDARKEPPFRRVDALRSINKAGPIRGHGYVPRLDFKSHLASGAKLSSPYHVSNPNSQSSVSAPTTPILKRKDLEVEDLAPPTKSINSFVSLKIPNQSNVTNPTPKPTPISTLNAVAEKASANAITTPVNNIGNNNNNTVANTTKPDDSKITSSSSVNPFKAFTTTTITTTATSTLPSNIPIPDTTSTATNASNTTFKKGFTFGQQTKKDTEKEKENITMVDSVTTTKSAFELLSKTPSITPSAFSSTTSATSSFEPTAAKSTTKPQEDLVVVENKFSVGEKRQEEKDKGMEVEVEVETRKQKRRGFSEETISEETVEKVTPPSAPATTNFFFKFGNNPTPSPTPALEKDKEKIKEVVVEKDKIETEPKAKRTAGSEKADFSSIPTSNTFSSLTTPPTMSLFGNTNNPPTVPSFPFASNTPTNIFTFGNQPKPKEDDKAKVDAQGENKLEAKKTEKSEPKVDWKPVVEAKKVEDKLEEKEKKDEKLKSLDEKTTITPIAFSFGSKTTPITSTFPTTSTAGFNLFSNKPTNPLPTTSTTPSDTTTLTPSLPSIFGKVAEQSPSITNTTATTTKTAGFTPFTMQPTTTTTEIKSAAPFVFGAQKETPKTTSTEISKTEPNKPEISPFNAPTSSPFVSGKTTTISPIPTSETTAANFTPTTSTTPNLFPFTATSSTTTPPTTILSPTLNQPTTQTKPDLSIVPSAPITTTTSSVNPFAAFTTPNPTLTPIITTTPKSDTTLTPSNLFSTASAFKFGEAKPPTFGDTPKPPAFGETTLSPSLGDAPKASISAFEESPKPAPIMFSFGAQAPNPPITTTTTTISTDTTKSAPAPAFLFGTTPSATTPLTGLTFAPSTLTPSNTTNNTPALPIISTPFSFNPSALTTTPFSFGSSATSGSDPSKPFIFGSSSGNAPNSTTTTTPPTILTPNPITPVVFGSFGSTTAPSAGFAFGNGNPSSTFPGFQPPQVPSFTANSINGASEMDGNTVDAGFSIGAGDKRKNLRGKRTNTKK